MPQLQTIIVILIVAAAAFFLARRFYNNLKGSASASCGCGCSGCVASGDCGISDSSSDLKDKNPPLPKGDNARKP